MIKGLIVILNGNCNSDLAGIYCEFIPTTDTAKASDYVRGNGDILGLIPYTLDTSKISDNDKIMIFDRIINLK